MEDVSKKNLKRIQRSKTNATVSLITSILMGIFSFAERTIFNQFFIEDYLGLYSFNFNIISSLNSIELGLGISIAYALYAPLEYNDQQKISAIIHFFKKAYLAIGTIIITAGIALLPFMRFLVKTEIPINEVRLYFMLFLLGNVSSYFFAYQNVLLNANQEQYKVTLVTNCTWATLYAIEILTIIKTRNFLYYSIVLFSANLLRNIILKIIADKEFKFVKYNKDNTIDKKTLTHIKKNTLGLISNKFGQVIVSSTDSILISMLIGTATLGKYSNYQMFYSGLFAISGMLPSAITASIGNAGVTENKRTMTNSFYTINFGSFLVYSSITVIFVNLVNPIISTFFGVDRILPMSTVLLYCFNFYLSNMRQLLLTYKTSLGLYWYDRKRPILEALVNLIASIILAKIMGLNGIILGTTISRLFVNFIIEPRIVFHRGLGRSTVSYYLDSLNSFLTTSAILAITIPIINLINVTNKLTRKLEIGSLVIPFGYFVQIIINFIISVIGIILVFGIFYRKSPEVKAIIKTLKVAFRKKEK